MINVEKYQSQEFREFSRNFIAPSRLRVFDELYTGNRFSNTGMGTVVGMWIRECGIVDDLVKLRFSPMSVSYRDKEVWFGSYPMITFPVTPTWSESIMCKDSAQYLGIVLDYLGIMEYDEHFTGAEAQDCSQIDADSFND